jgi:hypothetical protein
MPTEFNLIFTFVNNLKQLKTTVAIEYKKTINKILNDAFLCVKWSNATQYSQMQQTPNPAAQTPDDDPPRIFFLIQNLMILFDQSNDFMILSFYSRL